MVRFLRIDGKGLVAALGGGLAGVLLSMLTLQHPPLTLGLGYLAPLPLMLAVLGFGPLAGILALLVGAVFVAAFDMRLGHLVVSGLRAPAAMGLDVLVFLLALGLPALLLGTVARMRPRTTPADRPPTDRPEERLIGRVLGVAVVFAALAVSLVFVIAIVANGGLQAFNALLTETFQKIWAAVAARRPLPRGVDVAEFASQLTWLMPPLMSAVAVLFYVTNLWLAARVAQLSGLLAAPWPDLPRHLRVPRFTPLVLAVSLGLSFTGGLAGLIARIVSAALIAALALQGLAVAHAATRGKSSRVPLLVIVYLSMGALMPWPLLFWGVVGLLDTAFSFRDRQRPALIRKP